MVKSKNKSLVSNRREWGFISGCLGLEVMYEFLPNFWTKYKKTGYLLWYTIVFLVTQAGFVIKLVEQEIYGVMLKVKI